MLIGAGAASAALTLTQSTPPVQLNPGTLASFLRDEAPKYGIDPAAAMAVAAQEGLGGGVGDFGTSFGPWQMHFGGSLPSRVYYGPYSSKTQEWAWSKDGIDYALAGMARTPAHNVKGPYAAELIVKYFERPFSPIPEELHAAAAYKYYAYLNTKLTYAQKLRLKTGYWSWVAWRLGEGAWKGYGKANPRVRPDVPTRIPQLWWHQFALFLKARQ